MRQPRAPCHPSPRHLVTLQHPQARILKLRIRKAETEGVERATAHFHVIVALRETLVIIDWNLADRAGHRNREAARRIVRPEEHVRETVATLGPWVELRQMGSCVLRRPVLILLTTLNVYHHERLTSSLQRLEQRELVPQKR